MSCHHAADGPCSALLMARRYLHIKLELQRSNLYSIQIKLPADFHVSIEIHSHHILRELPFQVQPFAFIDDLEQTPPSASLSFLPEMPVQAASHCSGQLTLSFFHILLYSCLSDELAEYLHCSQFLLVLWELYLDGLHYDDHRGLWGFHAYYSHWENLWLLLYLLWGLHCFHYCPRCH